MNTYFILHKIALFISNYLSDTLRYLLYRKAVIEPANLILLHKSETAYHKAANKNKPITIKVGNKIKKIGFLGQLSQSMTLNKDFFNYPSAKSIELFLYELTASGYPTDPNLSKYNHNLFDAYWHKSKYDRVYKDTFDYNSIASKINEDGLDLLVVFIESIGRFTYGKLFDEIITSTKIVVLNPGNYFQVHPKIFGQGQIQLPPCWTIVNEELHSCYDYSINDFTFYPRLAFYDRRDIVIQKSWNPNFENSIFVSGRLSKMASEKYLTVVKKLLEDDSSRKFLFMGINDQNALQFILNFFESTSVKNQIEYLGHFFMNFNENKEIEDENWTKTKMLYKSAGIFLNPFPRGGGSSRMEAFASGLPVIDLEIDFMCKKQKHKKEYILEALMKNHGTAYSYEDYYLESIKALTDLSYRQKIINEQIALSKEFFEEKYFWDKIMKLID